MVSGKARERQLVAAFVDMADTLVDDYDVVELLHELARLSVDMLGAAAAGLLLADQRGSIRMVAMSDESPALVELFDVLADEGPCVDAYRTGKVVAVSDLAAAKGRWPAFAPKAVAEGYRSAQAIPLRHRRYVIGALNLLGLGPRPLLDDDVVIAQALADTATIGILQERALRRSEVVTEQLQTALNNRVIIEQAKGFLAHAGQIAPADAFECLRAYSRSNNTRLTRVSQDVLTAAIRADDILSYGPPRLSA